MGKAIKPHSPKQRPYMPPSMPASPAISIAASDRNSSSEFVRNEHRAYASLSATQGISIPEPKQTKDDSSDLFCPEHIFSFDDIPNKPQESPRESIGENENAAK